MQPLEVLKEEYKENKFENCFEELHKRYTHVRRARRDGSCFYRAFFYQYFEYFVKNKESPLYTQFLEKAEKSKADLVEQGYEEMVIEDFYDLFLDEAKKLKECDAEKVSEHLETVLCNKDTSPYFIMYARFLTSLYLKQNAILYEDFVGGSIDLFTRTEVEAADAECDHIQIIALCSYLGLGVEINSVTPTGAIEIIRLPEDFQGEFTAKLLLVPGHYDALYS